MPICCSFTSGNPIVIDDCDTLECAWLSNKDNAYMKEDERNIVWPATITYKHEKFESQKEVN
jgi:hypothetical protein